MAACASLTARAVALAIAALALTVRAVAAEGVPATLAGEDLSGTPRSLASLSGRIVLVNFWATWCLPCREELAMLARVHPEYEGRGVAFVAASVDEPSTATRVPDAITAAGVEFPVWSGVTAVDMQRLGVGTELPGTVIVDRDGRVAFRLLGLVPESVLRQRLDWLLGESDTEPPARSWAAADRAPAEDGDHHDCDGHADDAAADASLVPS